MKKWPLFKALFFIFSLYSMPLYAFSWQDLWFTQDQQAQALMQKGQYNKAQQTFEREDWRAAAAYRAGDYEHAAELYRNMKNEQAYYNLGNALAHMGRYEQAIAAYNKALAIDPDNQDALHNRNLLKERLKKEKQHSQQEKKQSEQKNKQQNKQEQQSSEKNQGSQEQKSQTSDKQERKDAQPQSGSDNQTKEQSKQEQENRPAQDKAQHNRHPEPQEEKQSEKANQHDEQSQQSQNKPSVKTQQNDQNKHDQNPPASQSDREAQQAKEQWLRVIPDDPGGLLRQKFLRDHLRRQHRW